MDTTRKLVREAVEQDLFGPGALLEAADVEAPAGYELIRPIGRGGFGTVYLARDEALDRPVAIKFLAGAGPADIERFRREARFAARLNNPAIVQVFELGEYDSRPYIAMQYLDGGNLADAKLDRDGVVRALRDVAVALAHAHAEGVVHRDIKPANILLDQEGHAYIADFGIARDLRGSDGATMSQDGQVMGTPGLMPPEQARGDIQAIDARSDIYALGSTMYFLLTGRAPFEAPHWVDVLHAVIHDEPPLPRSHDSTIPRSLESIIVKCMQKVREDRYPSMRAVATELDRFLQDGSTGGESVAWFRRLVGSREDAPAPKLTDDVGSDPFWTAGVEIVREIASWDADLYRVSGSLDRSFARLDSTCERLDRILEERPDMAWARFYRGVALFRRGRLDDAVDEMERSIDRVSNIAGAYFELGHLYLALYMREHQVARRHLAKRGVDSDLRSARRRLEQAKVALVEAESREGDLPPWHAGYTRAVTRLAEGDYDACISLCDEVVEREPDVEMLWKLRADALRFAGKDSVGSYDRALSIRRSYFEALYGKAEALLEQGSVEDARAALDRACEIHPSFTDAHVLLARTYLPENGDSGAPANVERGVAIARQTLELDPASYDAAVALAELLLERGDGKGAGEAIERARELSGCQNRVALLTARVNLLNARDAVARGGDPRPALDSAPALCRHGVSIVENDAAWRSMLDEVERERAALS